MFAPPPEVTAEVFARLPDELAGDPSTSEWAKVQHAGKNIPAFFEGPSFDRDGNLYIVDIAYGRILRVTPDAEFEVVCDYDGEPNGRGMGRDIQGYECHVATLCAARHAQSGLWPRRNGEQQLRQFDRTD